MEKIYLRCVIFMIAIFISLTSAAQALAQTNLLQNYGFETNDGQWWGEADYWEKGGSPSYIGPTTISVHQGNWAFSFGNDYGPANASGYCLQVLSDPANPASLYPITSGKTFTFTMWMTGETNYTGNAILKIEFYGYDRNAGYAGAPLATFTSPSHTGVFTYFHETVSGTAPAGTVSVAVVCSSEGMAAGSGSSAVSFDEGLVIVEKNILVNLSFEDNNGQWLGEADYWEKGGITATIGTIPVNAHQGAWAFNIGNDYGPPNAAGYCLQVLRDPSNTNNLYPITAGEIITFNMWMTGETNYTGNAILKIEFYGYDRNAGYAGAPLATFTSPSHTGAFTYFHETVSGTAPAGTVSVAVVCSSEGMAAGSGYSAVNFDDGRVIVQASSAPKEVIALNGTWQVEPSDTQPVIFNHTVTVPGLLDVATPPIVNITDYNAYNYFWYKTTFTLNSLQKHNQAFVNIGQSRYGTEVWLNGKYLGGYIGCYTSHKYDATDAINYDGENVLLVKVGQKRKLANLHPESAVGYDYEEDYFVPGIWGDVSLILTGAPTISRVQAIPHIDTSTAEARITVNNPENITQNIIISSRVFEKATGNASSDEITTNHTILPLEGKTLVVNIPITNMHLWSPDNPFLYNLVSKIKVANIETDTLTSTFGMREFKIFGSDFYLNGQRAFLKGGNIAFHRFLTDVQRASLPWNESWIKKILIDIPKAYGFNFFRIHMGHAYNKWYDIADEYGIMLEDEWAFRSPVIYPYEWGPGSGYGSTEQIRQEFTQWLYDNWNHPSIIIWDAQNEPHDGGEKSRGIIRDIIIPEMKLIDMTRPWECGINCNVDFEPGAWNPIDFSEDHPYIYSKGPVLNNDNFGYSRSIDGMANSNEPTLLNEFIWFWLKENGETGNFCGGEVLRWLGRNSNNEQHLEHQAFLASELCELWRRLDIDGMAPFCYLSSSNAGTTNWFTGDIADPGVKPIMAALKDAYAPFGVSIELWDRHFLPEEQKTTDVYVFNDTTQSKSGTLNYKITSQDGLEVLFEGNTAVDVSATDMVIQPIDWTLPANAGTYYLKAELIENSNVVATSKKIAHVCQTVIPTNLSSARIMIYDPDNEILDYLVSLALNAVTYDSATLSQQDILILGEGALLDTDYTSCIQEITDFTKAGHSLIVIEPSYNVTSYEKQEYSLLSDLSIAMNKREDKFEGGYDSYCFTEENFFIEAAASSVEDDKPEYAPEKAIDGNMQTRWSSQHSDPQWICLDFGQKVSISGVTLHWEAAYAVSYSIEVSDDKESWTEVYSTTTGDGDTDEITFSKVSARYVRMYGSQRATQWGYSLYEFEVDAELDFPLWNNIEGKHLKMFNGGFGGEMISQCDVDLPTNRKLILARSGLDLKYADAIESVSGNGVIVISRIQIRGRLTEESDPGTDLYSRREDPLAQQYLLNLISNYLDIAGNWQRIDRAVPFLYVKEVTASSVQDKNPGEDDPNFTPDKAIDNNLSTRWSSEPADPQWLCLDLGESVKFNKVILRWESACGKSYMIQVSDDKVEWTDAYSTTTGDGGIDEITFDTEIARYVRMYGTERVSNEWGYSLYEFEVYSLIATAKISGNVSIQGRTNNSELITLELRQPGQTTLLYTYQVTTASDGSYSLTNIPAGTYDLTAKSANSLRAKVSDVVVTAGLETPNIGFTLKGGDANNDNFIDSTDVSILSATYYKAKTDEGFDKRADFNNNDFIDSIDVSILSSNYYTQGEE